MIIELSINAILLYISTLFILWIELSLGWQDSIIQNICVSTTNNQLNLYKYKIFSLYNMILLYQSIYNYCFLIKQMSSILLYETTAILYNCTKLSTTDRCAFSCYQSFISYSLQLYILVSDFIIFDMLAICYIRIILIIFILILTETQYVIIHAF